MRRLVWVVGLGIGMGGWLFGCGDENESPVPKPELLGFAVTNVDTTNIANNGEVTLSVAATDSKGNLATERTRLRVWETPSNGEKMLVYDSQAFPAAPSLAAAPSRPRRRPAPPINLAMVLDRSGSMNRSEQADMQDAALALLGFLRHGDQVEVINVSTNVHVDASFRNFRSREVERAITHPSVRKGWTKIWDGVLQGVIDSAHAITPEIRRAVFLVTDGEDNRSEISLEGLIGKAQDLRVPVFILGLADASDPSDLHAEELETLAWKTGGRFVIAYSSTFFEEILTALTRSLTDELVLTYESPLDPEEPRTVTIELTLEGEPPLTKDIEVKPRKK